MKKLISSVLLFLVLLQTGIALSTDTPQTKCDVGDVVTRLTMSADLTRATARRCQFNLKTDHRAPDCSDFDKAFQVFKKVIVEYQACPGEMVMDWKNKNSTNKATYRKLNRLLPSAIQTSKETFALAKMVKQ